MNASDWELKTYLRILLDSFRSLFLRLAGPSTELCFERLLLLRVDFPRVGTGRVFLRGLGAHIQTLGVLLHREESLRLSEISADERRVAGNSFVAVCDCLGESHQFDEGGGAIGEAAGIFGGAFRHFGVGVDGAGPVCFFEFLVAEFARGFGLFGGDVCVLFGFGFGFFGGAKFGEDVRGAVLC